MLNKLDWGVKVRWSRTTAFAAAFAAGAISANGAAAETIKEAVEIAIAHHPQIYRDQALSVAADHFVEENFSNFLPTVDADVSSGYEWTNSPTTRTSRGGTVGDYRSEARLSVSQLVFDFFETTNRVISAQYELTSSNADVEASSQRIARLATRLYLDILTATERVVFAEQNVNDLTDILELLEERARAGRASEADLDQATSRVALARADLAELRGDVRQAVSRYVENVGRLPGELVRPQEPSYPESNDLDAALATAMDKNPIAASTAALWKARKADVEVERAAYFPRFDLEASGRTGDNLDGVEGLDSDVQLLLRMRWNLFSGLGDLARTRRATFEAFAAAETDADARRLIREAVRTAYRDLETARDRLPPLLDDTIASQATFDGYLEQFGVGQRSLLDLLDAREELFDAQEEEVGGIYAVLQSHYELLFAMGVLLDSLGLTVFQDEEQYSSWDTITTAPPTLQVSSAVDPGLTFAEADWTAEVAVPGGSEFGTWIGEQGYISEQGVASEGSPEQVQTSELSASPIRREFDGIDVETVPAMGDLPVQEVDSLSAAAVGETVAPQSRSYELSELNQTEESAADDIAAVDQPPAGKAAGSLSVGTSAADLIIDSFLAE